MQRDNIIPFNFPPLNFQSHREHSFPQFYIIFRKEALYREKEREKKEVKGACIGANAQSTFTNERADVSSSVRPAGGACLM